MEKQISTWFSHTQFVGRALSLGRSSQGAAVLAWLTQRQLKRGSQLKTAIGAFIEVTNDKPTPFRWTATADGILLGRITRFAQATLTVHRERETSAGNQ